MQVTFPEYEEYEKRRKFNAEQMNIALGIVDGSGPAMALSLKRAHLNHKDDGLTLEEREEQAESRFKAI